MHSNTVSENVIVACESPMSRIINVNIREPGNEIPMMAFSDISGRILPFLCVISTSFKPLFGLFIGYLGMGVCFSYYLCMQCVKIDRPTALQQVFLASLSYA